MVDRPSPLDSFQPAVRDWFRASFSEPTPPQREGWPAIARGESTLILAPTGTGKTLAAFLTCLDRLMFQPAPEKKRRCRVLYVSPLKALAVDVERNLRAPLAGIANVAAARGEAHRLPSIGTRTGDTPSKERARFQREPTDILITTPESLYLLLTSNARETLRSIDTVIIDEIHALVPTKRGAHLALSLERLEQLADQPIQRIGLSATQRPLEEVARFLGGAGASLPDSSAASEGLLADPGVAFREEFAERSDRGPAYRPITLVNAGAKRAIELKIEVPVEDMAKLGQPVEIPSGPASQGPVRSSIWTAIHPRLLELVKSHQSTLIFVNSRRVAERLAGALNELEVEGREEKSEGAAPLVLAHHGSIARAQRTQIEDALKAGKVRGLVATSSLELGIDMGAIDLVVQIEAPPSVASGMQRVGRAGHRIDASSEGIIFPKFRSDLVACAALTRAMHEGQVESSRYPRNPLDILAQQIVAMVALEEWDVERLFEVVRSAAPFAELSRTIFDGVLDMLAGRFTSDELSELQPRVTWDRLAGKIKAREGARRIAVINGGTIPDRGLYGVFLAGADRGSARVGELDEEMVFESRVGETFLLGASTWRIEEITFDRVLVSPAPGEPGKMPFWRGDAAGRPLELGRKIGELIRSLADLPLPVATDLLVRKHDLTEGAAKNLLQYLADQREATGAVPDDRTLVIERVRDELGDWRICVLSPLGGQIHAPWSMAVVAKVKEETGIDVETMWSNDGFVVRFPESVEPPDPAWLLISPDEIEKWVVRQLGSTALFAAKFRETASRALLLPKRRPGGRAPLWQLRKRSSDLLAAASQFTSFPMLLETYRECLRDVFDMPSLVGTLRDLANRSIRVVTVDSQTASPFAASLLFGYVANYIYDGDAPLAERRAQALSIDQTQLKELLGDAELRELLDADALAEVEAELQRKTERFRAKNVDAVHDLLLRLGDLTDAELEQRVEAALLPGATADLDRARRILSISIRGEKRWVPVEYAGRYRDGLGTPLPQGLPEALLVAQIDPVGDLALRYARTHAPFTTEEWAQRYGLARHSAETVLHRLTAAGKLIQGAFRPGGIHREWSDPEVLKQIRRRSLAKLRNEVEPVGPHTYGRMLTVWHGLQRKGSGPDALLDAIERLQGAALPASLLERDILPARVDGYLMSDLDALAAAGEVVWCGVEPLGERDGRVALYLTDSLPKLWRPPAVPPELTQKEARAVELLRERGASFFADIHQALGGGFPADAVDALWGLVWKGLVTNDTFRALRAYTRPAAQGSGRRLLATGRAFRSRRVAPPAAEGRWSLLETRGAERSSSTEWGAAYANQLLARYGLVTREVGAAESVQGGFSAVYDVFKALEEAGRIRRGYFVTGVGAMQFALPTALDLLRSLRDLPDRLEVVTVAATDPANPYGALLPWPKVASERGGPTRSVGAQVVLVNGSCAAYLRKGGRQLLTFFPEDEPDRSSHARCVAFKLAEAGRRAGGKGEGLLIVEVDGVPTQEHFLAMHLLEAGFTASSAGFLLRRGRSGFPAGGAATAEEPNA